MSSRERRNLAARESYRKRRAAETPSQAALRKQANQEAYQRRKAAETPSQAERRKQATHEAYQRRKAIETPSQAERRKAAGREAYQRRKEKILHGGTERNEARRAANTQLQRIRRANETVEITNRRREIDRNRHNARNYENNSKLQLHQQYLQRIFTFPDTPCMICRKLLYPRQVFKINAASLSVHARLYLPDELKHVDLLLVCKRHKTYLTNSRKSQMPANAYWNNMDPGEIPEELSQLNIYERRLLSRIFLYQNIINLTPSHRSRYWNQPALRGQVIHFYQDIHEVPAQLLPRPPNECGMVVVSSHLQNVDKIVQLKVDFPRLERALYWLKENNPLYADVEIDLTRDFSVQQICRVPQERPVPVQQSWVIKGDTRVLRGSMHQGYGIFDIWAGKQCVAMCVTAVVKSKVKPVVEWTPNDLDDILLKGNAYYKKIVDFNPEFLLVKMLPKSNGDARERGLSDVNRLFDREFVLDYADDPEFYGATTNLLERVQTFFAIHAYGIIIDSRNYARLIFRLRSDDSYVYYLFDSHSCTATGATGSTGRGKAAIVEAPSVELLVRVLKRSFQTATEFTLDSLDLIVFEALSEEENNGHDGEVRLAEEHENHRIEENEDSTLIEMQHSVLFDIDPRHPSVSDVAAIPNEEQVNINDIHRKTTAPVNVFHEKLSEEMAWFHLFPYGNSGLNQNREVKITPLDYLQTRIMGSDRRFQSSDYLMYALSMFEFLRASSNISVCGKKLRQNGNIVDNLHLYVKNLRGSGAYFTDCVKELTAMVTQLGPPTFFMSFSSNDLNWTDLRSALLIADGQPNRDPTELTAQETQNLLEKYPVLVQRHFQNRFLALLDLMKHDETLLGGKLVDYWWRMEFQDRGSVHLHKVAWVERFPHLESTNEDVRQAAIEALNKIVSCHIPDQKEDSDLHELVKTCQMHRHTTSCYKKSAHCRFGFPRRPSPETRIIDASTENAENLIRNGGRICILERDEGEEFVNNYHPELLKLWRANMDIQPCGSAMAIAYYITKYVSKSEPSHFDSSLREAIMQINRNIADPLQRVFRSIMEMFNRRLVSIGECALRLCNLKYKTSSRKSVFVNSRTPDKRYTVINMRSSEEDNSFASTMFDRYTNRPTELELLSLFDFAMWYEPCYNRTQNVDHDAGDEDAFEGMEVRNESDSQIILRNGQRMNKRTRAAIVKTPSFSVSRNAEEYFYHLLVLYLPFRSESELKEGFPSAIAAFEARQEQLQGTLERLRPLRNLARELEIAMEHLETFDHENVQPHQNQELEIVLPENNEPHFTDTEFNNNRQALNLEQQRLFQHVKSQIDREIRGENSNPLRIFVTGSAGTGKSFTLKMIAELIRRRYQILDQNGCFVKVCAYTGVAAILIEGQTLHSVFRLKVQKGRQLPDLTPLTGIWAEQYRRMFRNIRFVIIDEVSMLPYELLCQINLRLQELKDNRELFGGVNILLFGDLMQLPPVIGTPIYLQPEEMIGTLHLFRQFDFCELTEIIRQRGDTTFVDLLNNLREGRLTAEQYEILLQIQMNSRQEGRFALGRAIRIMPTNRLVNEHNLSVMSTEVNVQQFEITAQDRLLEQDSRRINVPLENIVPGDVNKTAGVPKSLTIYTGLRIMLRYNVDITRRLVNGSMGVIINVEFPGWRRQQLYREDIPRVQVEFDNNVGTHWIDPITVTFDAKFGYGSVERRMLPMVPCYAVTVHKLQGSTIDTAVVNLGPQYFAPGQKFVALGRCTSLLGMEIDEIDPRGLIEGEVCDEEALEEMHRLRELPRYNIHE